MTRSQALDYRRGIPLLMLFGLQAPAPVEIPKPEKENVRMDKRQAQARYNKLVCAIEECGGGSLEEVSEYLIEDPDFRDMSDVRFRDLLMNLHKSGRIRKTEGRRVEWLPLESAD